MKKPLFDGVVADWYIQRLQQMYKHRPKCGTHLISNHLLGTCTDCGAGRLSRSSTPIQHISLDRIYTMRIKSVDDVQQLRWLLGRGMLILTNLEFPLPVVKHHTYSRCAKFYEPATRTAFDFDDGNRNHKKVFEQTDATLAAAGIRYLVYRWDRQDECGYESYRSRVLDQEDQNLRVLATALKHFVQRPL